jgi:aerobic-type carbon monoxide dehydrogenase small subunit (CoxS/CutS family)
MTNDTEQEYRPQQQEGQRLSRRGFIKGAGVSAAGAALLEGCASSLEQNAKKAEAAAEPKLVGPGAVAMSLNINGQARKVSVEPRTTLADVLRDELELTGTKVVCDRGACSACTVYLDGTPVCSCMTLAIDTVGRQIRTIEGLAEGNRLHPVQEAFVEHDALQCGFCTPGMVMSCAALLRRKPNPTEEDVRQAVSGNLCRCGTYPKVIEATLAAARQAGTVKGA